VRSSTKHTDYAIVDRLLRYSVRDRQQRIQAQELGRANVNRERPGRHIETLRSMPIPIQKTARQ